MKRKVFSLIAAALFVAAIVPSCKDDDDDNKVAVTGVTLNEGDATLEVGGTLQLTATVVPASATNKEVTWSSSNPGVAGVSNTGLVTATGDGTATITATTTDGGKTARCNVTVNSKVAVTGVTIDEEAITLEVDGTLQLTATVAPANATNKAVTWTSSNTSIAEVSNLGLVTAKALGQAAITVTTTDGGKVATCNVTVAPPQDIEKHNWTIVDCSSSWHNADGSPHPFTVTSLLNDERGLPWHTHPSNEPEDQFPHWVIVDMKKNLKVTGFIYGSSTADSNADSYPKKMRFETSMDGLSWSIATVVDNIETTYRDDLKTYPCDSPVTARYFKIVIESNWSGAPYTYIGTITIY